MGNGKFWLAALLFGVSTTATAQEQLEDTQTAITGTEDVDDIDVPAASNTTATISTIEGGELSATATGVDALAENDTIDGAFAITTNAIAAANLLSATQATEAKATSVGVNAGEGDDQVTGALGFTSTASASGIYAGAIDYAASTSPTPPKKIEVSISTEASATGIDSGDGDDQLSNDALFAVTSLATSGGSASQFSATVQDSLSFKSKSEATASATGISSGGDSDEITNNGLMTNTATATSGALAVALVAPKDENAPTESQKTQIKSDANSTATATATGINSADDSTEDSSEEATPWGLELAGLKVTYHKTVTTSGSDDVVENNVVLLNSAIATSGAGAGGVSNKVDGSMEASATSEAKAESSGITTGVASDRVTNHGELLSNATANAGALSVSIEVGTSSEDAPTPAPGELPEPAKPSEDKENKSSTKTSVTAEATASGINTEGSGSEEITDGFAEISNSELVIDYHQVTNTVAGNDVVENHGAIQAIANANAGSLGVGVTQSSGGSSSSESKSIAKSNADGITTGGGNDRVTNDGILTVSATSDASALNVGMAVGMPAEETPGEEPAPDTESDKVTTETSTEVEAEAEVVGIDTAGESNSEVTRHAVLDLSGISIEFGESSVAAIDNDVVENNGIMTATATATASAADAGIALDAVGSVNSDASATAKATSNGISTGAGNDTISNQFLFTANSSATAESLSIGITASKPTTGTGDEPDKTNVKVKAGATAEANTSGIDAEGSGHETSKHTSISLTANGLEVVHTTSDVSHAGSDRVTNNGAMIVGATASSGTVAAGATIGVAGSVDADSTSKSDASSRAIHTGGGADIIENSGLITSTANADALAVAFSLSVGQPEDSSGTEPPTPEQAAAKAATMRGATNAEATALASGIDAEGSTHSLGTENRVNLGLNGLHVVLRSTSGSVAGDDQVTNTGGLSSTATASAGAGAAGVAIQSEGTASADTKATAKSTSSAVLTGGGNDQVSNQGGLLASATSTAGALSVSFSQTTEQGSKAKSDARASSEAQAVGIGTGSEESTREREAILDVTASGIVFLYSDETLSDDGADTVTNGGAVIANATATSGALGAAIAVDGAASADVTASSKARTEGLDLGAGNDNLVNDGVLTATSISTSGALGIAFGQQGTEKKRGENKAEATSTADSEATGIRADSGANTLSVGSLVINASGIEGHLDYTNEAVSGNDTVVNRGGIGAIATATAGAAGATVAIDGAAKADVDSVANSRATAIDGGGGDDNVRNEGVVLAVANSTAATVAVAVKVGDNTSTDKAKVEASSTATASSAGISTDGAAGNAEVAVDLTINSAGLDYEVAATSSAASGNDTLNNLNTVVAQSTANSGAGSVAFTVKGAANAATNSTAEANSAALDTGAGADVVNNSGALGSRAEANAYTLNAAITNEGNAISNTGFLGAGTTAKAHAAGISTQGMEEDTSIDAELHINIVGANARFELITDSLLADGTDQVTNSGAIDVDSIAVAPRLNVGITGKGLAVSMGRASSESRAAGIETGDLDDVIDNSGVIEVSTTSTATLVNAAISGKGVAGAANAVWDGGTEATAVAAGIDADSGKRNSLLIDVVANAELARVRYTQEVTSASGDDVIRNNAAVTSTASATAPSLNLAVVSGTGLSAAVSTSTATADSFSLRGGDGDDEIQNTGRLISASNATAVTANISYSNTGAAIAADAVWDGGTKATANSIGIAGDGGDRTHTRVISIGTDGVSKDEDSVKADGQDTIVNSGAVDATADAFALSISAAVTSSGVAAATATSTSTANASAIDAGAGDSIDDVENSGALRAIANADAYAASIGVTNNGVAGAVGAVWDGGTKANARARGIDVGAGGEVVVNSGSILADSDAQTLEASVAVAMNGVAAATATSTSTADSTAIDASAGADADHVINSGALTADAGSNAITAALSFTNNGASISADAVWDGGTTANARARGIDVGAAADVVENTGDMLVTSHGETKAIQIAATVNGGAGAIATSTVNSSAAGIDAGDEDVRDEVTNSGDITSTAGATAVTATVSFALNGVALASDAAWNGGTHADTYSRGIKTGDGSDDIDNSGLVRANAEALAVSANVAVAVNGVAGAIATATTTSSATALDAGDAVGNDLVENEGQLFADSTANAAAVAVSFTAAGVAVSGADVWDGGVEAHSAARGISVGAGTDRVENGEAIDSRSRAHSTGVSVAISVQGVAGAITTATAVSDAYGIDGAAGDDTLLNEADIVADSVANANSISVAGTLYGVSAAGNNAWDGGVTSTARSAAISGGTGIDTIVNEGDLTSQSNAISPSVSVSFTVAGVSAAVSTATSNAEANAITGGDDADEIENLGALDVDATSTAVSVNVSLAAGGVAIASDSVWAGGTTSNADAIGITGGNGDDEIATRTAAGTIDATAHAMTGSVSFSVTGVGFAASISTSTANADAAAIDGGTGRDIIFNDSVVTGTAEADATSVGVAIAFEGAAVAADAFWDGGTKANSTAAGLSGGDGNDDILNAGTANAIADSETLSVQVAATFGATIGLSAAAAASTSTADAFAIRGGIGNDQLTNTGTLLARSDAAADGVSVSFTPQGATMAGAFDAGTRGNVSATGISGGDGTDTLINAQDATIALDASSRIRDLAASMTFVGVALAISNAEATTWGYGLDGGAGADTLTNAGVIQGTVDATSTSTALSAVGIGGGAVSANSTANANGAALAGGLGDDRLSNTGNIDLDFNTNARGLSVAVAGVGAVLSQANADSTIVAHGQHGDAGADVLANTGNVTIDSNATVTALSVSVAGIGGSLASANSVANSATTGMAGGADADLVFNDADGVVDVHAGAILNSNAVAVSITGASIGEARTAAQVTGTGLSGGTGNDGVENRGDVVVTAGARSIATGYSFNVTGASISRAGTEANSTAVGIDGGSGDDLVLNSGNISVGPGSAPGAWMAHLTANSQGVGVLGGADAQSATLARTQSTGINGGEGADQLRNTGNVSVRANAFTEANSGTINVFGSAGGGGKSGAFTTATGMYGAAGDDLLASLTTLSVSAESSLYRNGTSFTFGGAGSVDSELVAETEALGLGGGDGDDEIAADGTVTVSATSNLTSTGGGTTVFGSAVSAGTSGAITFARGIDGGTGDDLIDNAADITLTAASNLSLNNSSYTFGGSNSTSGTLAAITGSEGIMGGAGADSIANAGVITLNATSTLTSTGDSSTTFGGAGDLITSGGVANAKGIAGGDEDDVLENYAQGRIEITATANVTTNSMAYTFAGTGPSTGAVLTGEVNAAGMSGDTGDDTVVNRGTVHVNSVASLTSRGGSSASFTGTSAPDSTGTATVVADAVGLAGGEGDDLIGNLGELVVHARGDADAGNDAGTGAASLVNGNTAGAVTRSTVTATGIDGGAGINRMEVDGAVTVEAESISYSLATSSGANVSFQSDGESVADSNALATAIGANGLAGDDTLLNLNVITVTADATTSKTPEFTVIIYRDVRAGGEDANLAPPPVVDDDELPPLTGYEVGDVIYLTEPANSDRDPNNTEDEEGAHYRVEVVSVDPDGPGNGEDPHDEEQWVFLSGGLYQPVEVKIDLPSFPSYAAANGGGANGEGFAYAVGSATAVARGVALAAGDNVIENQGSLVVQANAAATMYTSSDGDGFGDSFGSATATASALAVGIEVGEGDDVILNSGLIRVTAMPAAQTRAQSSTDEICIWFFGWWCGSPGDSEGDASSTVHSEARGISAGHGDNRIVNDGELTVISRPQVRNDPNFGEFVASISAEENDTLAVNVTSSARGIDTGDGDDEIINNGQIRVEAWDLTSDCSGSCAGLPPTSSTVTASGIVTGAGNDVVQNMGSLSVETIANNVRTSRVAIDTGTGNDELHLGDGSSIVGTVSLGDGDDLLSLFGTPTITNSASALLNVDAGAGIDTLVLNGLGSYAGTPVSIERAIKREVGTYTLASLPSLQNIAIEDGTLRAGGNYTFAPGSSYQTFFNVDGDSGVFSVSGNATLAGGIEVERRGDTFVANGARFNVVHADGVVGGDFTVVELPEARPLLSFELQRTTRDVDVVARAASFATVTDNPLYRRIAVGLDDIALGSTGDLADLFGAIQNLESDFDRALASLSPDTHLATSGSVFTNLQEMTRVLQGHLSDTRLRYRHVPHARLPDAVVSFSGGGDGLGVLRVSSGTPMFGMADLPAAPSPQMRAGKAPRSQAWMLGIGGESSNEAVEGYSAFDTDTQGYMLGADRRVGDDWLLGVTLGQAQTDIASSDLARGEIDSWLASAYATWFDESLHFATGLSIGSQDFADTRFVNIAADQRSAVSEHGGMAWSAFVSGGMSIESGSWAFEPYLSLNYYEAREDGFQETGADAVSQLIDSRRSHAFLVEAGANVSYRKSWSGGLIDWHASLALSHDFAFDDGGVTYSYVGAPGSVFSIDGRPVDESGTLYGLGVSFIRDQSAVALDYRGLNNSDREEKFLSARISLRF